MTKSCDVGSTNLDGTFVLAPTCEPIAPFVLSVRGANIMQTDAGYITSVGKESLS